MMLRWYFKTSWKYLWHHKQFSFINIGGLAIGLLVFYFSILYIRFELNFDGFNKNRDRIYRLVTDVQTQTGTEYQSSSAPMADALKAEFPEIRAAARIFLDNLIVQKGENNFADETIGYADADLFKVFTLPLKSGNPDHILDAPYTVVLSETAGQKYFGSQNPVGQSLLLDGKFPALVTAVMKNMPHNSHFRVDILVSLSTLLKEWNTGLAKNWERFGFYTYLLLESDHADPIKKRLPAFVKEHFPETQLRYTLALEPLKSVYLYGKPRGSRTGTSVHGNRNNIYLLLLVSIFILALATINFINLATALSLNRAKEISIRKIVGARRSQLIIQFMLDAMFLAFIAYLLTLLISFSLLPLFNTLAGKKVAVNIFDEPATLLVLLGIALLTGFISGFYPAILLGNINPVKNLKAGIPTRLKQFGFRRISVVTQFTVSFALIIATLVIYGQLEYMQTKDLGFKKDHLLVIDFHFDERILTHTEIVKGQLTKLPGITHASMGSAVIGRAGRKLALEIENNHGQMTNALWDLYAVDKDFIPQYNLQIVAGRNFSGTIPTDTAEAAIINETASRVLGYSSPEQAIGQKFVQKGSHGTITGVVKDFHFSSYSDEIQPLVFKMSPWFFTFLTLNVSTPDPVRTVQDVEKKWKTIVPGLPFIYSFSDETYDAQYRDEVRFGQLFICFAVIAIFISALGLYALSLFSVRQKRKEIGIRKLLGASLAQILSKLFSELFKPIGVAILIGTPLTRLLLHQWLLNNYAYRISPGIWMFLKAGALVLIIALLTTGYHSVKAALANPVETLKSE